MHSRPGSTHGGSVVGDMDDDDRRSQGQGDEYTGSNPGTPSARFDEDDEDAATEYDGGDAELAAALKSV